jgi:hypothetical protein
MLGLTPEETRDTFLNKLKGVAQSNARLTIDRDRYKVTDELSLDAAKNKAANGDNDIFEYDPYTKVVKPGLMDETYFKPNYISPGASSPFSGGATFGGNGMPQGAGRIEEFGKSGDASNKYKPFTKEQEPLVKEILADKLGIDPMRITGFDLNKPENRKILEKYYKENSDNIRITPKVESTSFLREYGGKPEAASKDLMDNYVSKQFIDAETRKPLTQKEVSQLLSDGNKFNVMGVYGTGSGFTADAEANGINPKAMTRPMAVNIVNEDGEIIKRVAASRPASHYEGFEALETTQQDMIVDKIITTPNVFRTIPFSLTRDLKGEAIAMEPINIKIKFNSNQGNYSVQSPNGEFNTFSTNDVSKLNEQILQNVKRD